MILKDNYFHNEIKPVNHCVMCGKTLTEEDETCSELCVCNRCKDIL